jgi:hypothetical protein
MKLKNLFELRVGNIMQGPEEHGCFYVVYDAEARAWNYGFTLQGESGLLEELRVDRPAVCVWRVWKTKWPKGQLAALKAAVWHALVTYLPSQGACEWFRGSPKQVTQIVCRLIEQFEANLRTRTEEVAFD